MLSQFSIHTQQGVCLKFSLSPSAPPRSPFSLSKNKTKEKKEKKRKKKKKKKRKKETTNGLRANFTIATVKTTHSGTVHSTNNTWHGIVMSIENSIPR